MTDFNYSLDETHYSWHNALLWGNFLEHCKKTNEGRMGIRIIHALIAAVEFLPIISQISSVCEKLIIGHFFTTPQSLTDKHISIETSEYKKKLLSELPETIERQQIHKTYNRNKLIPLDEQSLNVPILLSSSPKKTQYFSRNATFYSYNAENIRDHGWGCAWRAIQTCLSAYERPSKRFFTFQELFHLFGTFENLKMIYENKYPAKELSNANLFAPYDLPSGWAEPFVAHMVMHFFNITSALETVNGIPDNCNAPHDVFHNPPLGFNVFKERLENHFKAENPAPVMIDNGIQALNIVGIEQAELNTILWIADPHINEGVNKIIDQEKSPSGLYKVTLNDSGKQIKCSLYDEDIHQIPNMFCKGSYQGITFDTRHWMVLFPLDFQYCRSFECAVSNSC